MVSLRSFLTSLIASVVVFTGFTVPVAAADTLAVVPFAQPSGEPNRVLEDATGILTTAMAEKGLTFKTLDPINRLAVVSTAKEICAKTGAAAILVPAARTEQAVRTKNYVLTSVNYFATHVELRLTRLRCDGSVAWSSIMTGDKDYYASNVQAAVSDSLGIATRRALDAYMARGPEGSATPLAASMPVTGARTAIVPFAQPGGPDPSLDFATAEALKRYTAKGTNAVVTDATDFLVATHDANALCAKYSARQLVMGELRTEQTPKFSGIATHAEVRLTTVDCNGKVLGTQVAIGEHMHHGSNYRAGVSSAIEDAFGHWSEITKPEATK